MFLTKLRVVNFRSIRDTSTLPVSRLLSLIGENNSGKSNIMAAVQLLMSAGKGGIGKGDFNDPGVPITITGTFSELTNGEKQRWQKYLVGGELILEKRLTIETDSNTGKEKVSGEFHGYTAEPKEWFLSPAKIEEKEGARPKWVDIVQANGLPDYFLKDGKCNKSQFISSLKRYLTENSVEYEEPDLSVTQALGLESNVIASLPTVHFLRAITDYSDEIDKRSSTTTFRRLMGDLSERILKNDPDYGKIEEALRQIRSLLNAPGDDAGSPRLKALSTIETKITELLKKLMPSVMCISMSVDVDDIKDMFSGGISLAVNDGIETDVLAKGHGLQRCIVFTLLQTLIMNEREQLVPGAEQPPDTSSIILAIEEPELYIHPQLAKLFYDVMKEFSVSDQVIYATHSPLFVDAFEHDSIAIVTKPSIETGTVVTTCDSTAFDGLDDRKVFKGLTRLNPAVNEMFFAKRVLLVEGPEDQIAVSAYLLNEGRIQNRIEELDWSIIVAGGKAAIPFFQRVLNAFAIPYVVLHDLDINPDMNANDVGTHKKTNQTIAQLAGANRVVTFPVKLERSLGIEGHLRDQYRAHQFFQPAENMTEEFRNVVASVFE
ncbi:MAG: AAA family ATPase [Thermodesulfobacteriota bacterium]|nr:AAA family ATPase [Thermodesulfobacteriota bacterium]